MTSLLRRFVVGVAITGIAVSLAYGQPTPLPNPKPGPGTTQPTLTPQATVILPASFGPKYGSVLTLMDELNTTQNQYLAAKTRDEKSFLERRIKELVEQIIARATQLKVDLEDNKYVNVPSFSVVLGIPPVFNFQLDFTFKPRK